MSERARGLLDDYPLLSQRAEQHDFAERLGGSTDPLMAEIDQAMRELWMSRRQGNVIEALQDAVDVAVWLTGQGELSADSAWPEMRAKLNKAMKVLLDAGIQVGEPEEPV